MPTMPDRQPSLLVAGGLHVDEIASLQADFVEQASNPVSWQLSVGGVASNAARAAKRHFEYAGCGFVNLHCALGNDAQGKSLASALTSKGIEVSAQWLEGHTSDRYSAVINNSGDLVMGLSDITLAEKLHASQIIAAIDTAEISHLLMDANLNTECVQAIAQAANSASITVAAMPVSPAKAIRLLPVANQINILFCNRREAIALSIKAGSLPAGTATEKTELLQLAKGLHDAGFMEFVLTDGAADILIGSAGECTRHSIPRVPVTHNVNGAGDALTGASFAAVSLDVTLEQAVATYGIRAAAEIITGKQSPLTL